MSEDTSPKTNTLKTRRSFIAHVVFQTAFTFLTSGVFLSGIAMNMGASDTLISYLNINICGISILLFSSLMVRFLSFKKVTVFLTILSRLATLAIVLIPLVIPGKAQIGVFIPVMIIAFALQAQTTVVLNNWMVSFVDEKQSGRYIAKRQTFVLIITVILALAGGRLLDAFSGAYIGFIILFSVALIMAAVEVIILLRIPDAAQIKSENEKSKFIDMILVPIKCKPFLLFVIYIFLFYLFLSFADSFTIVYMIRYLKLPYLATTSLQLIITLPQIFLLGIWGKISEKKGHRFSLALSIWLFLGETLFLALTGPSNLYIFIPIAFSFAAVANAGFTVSVFNRRYELMPKERRVLYDNFFTAAVGLAFILGPVTGGGIKGLIEQSAWLSGLLQFGNIRILFVISTFALLVLQLVFLKSNSSKNNPLQENLLK